MSEEMRKTALISGAATGIGRESAVRLAKDGFDLFLGDWNRQECEATTQLCLAQGVQAEFSQVDMGDGSQTEEFVKSAVDRFGHIDFYFNNQGVIHMPKLLDELTEDELDALIHSNFRACFLGMKHVLTIMKAQGYGHIVNTASSSGLRGESGFSLYSATKHAVVGLTKTAAMEYAPYHIRVNCICPGGIMTPLTLAVSAYMNETHYQQPITSMGLLGRMGTTREVGALVSYLASDASQYMTGAAISLDGGITV